MSQSPQVHSTQAAWVCPPVDGSLTIPEIFDWHHEHNPQHPFFVYADDEGSLKYITMKEAVHAMHQAARHYTAHFSSLGHPPSIRGAPAIAIFAASDTITYVCTWIGIARAGYTVFHISPRNSPAAVAYLLQHTNVVHVLTSGEPGIKAVVRAALAKIDSDETRWDGFVSEMPSFAQLSKEDESNYELLPKRIFDPNALICYIHSSGTTNFPKPIPYTNEVYLGTRLVYEGAHDFCGRVLAVQSIPMFHGLGIVSVVMAACKGVILSTFKPQEPAIPVSADTVWEAATLTRALYIFVVPMIIEAWSRDPAKIAALAKNTKGVLYGGGALRTAIGDSLVDKGVDVYVTYGASENGMKAPILPVHPGRDWEYFTLLPSIHAEFIDYGNDTYELVVVKSATHSPRLFNTKWNGTDAYATGDLLVPHPTKDGFWKVFGRADDQIVLSNGEKTNPGPLEDILSQDPSIKAAIMFGRGRFQNGVIIQPAQEHVVDPHDDEQLANFRRRIWPTVEKMNEFAPQHSRLFKEMIIVASKEKPFFYTPKGSIRRSATLELYEAEIHTTYHAVAETAQEDIPVPPEWSLEFALPFVRRVVSSVIKASLEDDDDLFQHGCDSLQATWIRNSIARALRRSTLTTIKVVPEGMVYMHPTIANLALFCSRLDVPETSKETEHNEKRKAMLALVEKYAQSIPPNNTCSSTGPPLGGSAILITGTTGSLGSSLLEALISSKDVTKIYALNRPASNGEALDVRQRRSFVERGLDETLLSSKKVVLLESDLCGLGMGLSRDILEEMRCSVIGVIHNAWRVDFNLALTSFESSIKAIRSLVDFASSTKLAKPPRIVFTSSVSVLRNSDPNRPAPEAELQNPDSAMGSGYSESKWVSERILARASLSNPALETVIVRVGQLAGGPTGAWNANEWFPSAVRSGRILGCLPMLDADVSWLPMHVAAAALVEITLAPSAPGVLHLAHPHPVSWSSIITVVARELRVPLVSYPEWLQALEDSLKDQSKSEVDHMRANPALRLLSFFKSIQGGDALAGREAMNLPLMDTTRTQGLVPLLRELPPLCEADVMGWMAFWKKMGDL